MLLNLCQINTMENIIYSPTREQVARAIINSGSYQVLSDWDLLNPAAYYKWKCGVDAPVYTNCRNIMGYPGASAVVMNSLINSIRNSFPTPELIIGMESAGIYWSTGVAIGMSLPHAFIRKQPKDHGGEDGCFVGCTAPLKNITAIIVDDAVASGETLEEAIQKLQIEKGIKVLGVQSILNWNFNEMSDRFRRLNIPVKGLVTYTDVLKEALNQDVIDEELFRELDLFYKNHRNHVFDFRFIENRIRQAK